MIMWLIHILKIPIGKDNLVFHLGTEGNKRVIKERGAKRCPTCDC